MAARVPTYKGTASPWGQNGVAAVNTNLYSIFNKTGSGVLVAIRDLTVRTNQSGDSGTVRTFKLTLITTAPTTGTICPKNAWDTSQSSSANVEARGGPASADYGASVTLTATPGSTAVRTFGVRRNTGVGQFLQGGTTFAPLSDLAVDPIVLAEGEGVLLTVVESGTSGMQYIVNSMFEEFTYAGGAVDVTPSPFALVFTGFAPTVIASDHKVVTPTPFGLVWTGFAPTVVATDHKAVTPTPFSLTWTGFAPDVQVSAGGSVDVTPNPFALAWTGFAPTVAVTDHKVVTPTPFSVAWAGLAPTVAVTDHKAVTPDPFAVAWTGFAPTVTATGGEGPSRLQVPIGTARGRPVTVRMPYG